MTAANNVSTNSLLPGVTAANNVSTMEFTPEQLKALVAFVAFAINKKQSEVIALVKSDDPDADPVTTLKASHTDFAESKMTEGGKKEVGFIKKAIKKVFGVDIPETAKTAEEIVNVIKESQKAKDAEGETDETKIKASKVYQDLETTVTTKDGELKDLKAQHVKELAKRDITSVAIGFLSSKNAIIPEKESAKASREKAYLTELFGYEYESDNKGGYFVKNPDGSYRNNAAGHKTTLEELATQQIEDLYGVATVQQRNNAQPPGNNNPGNDEQQNGAFKEFKGVMPKTADEYQAILIDDNITGVAKGEVRTAWKAANP